MSGTEWFLDTNVLLYLLSGDDAQAGFAFATPFSDLVCRKPACREAFMNYSDTLAALRSASPCDLFRLRAAIDPVLEQPGRMQTVHARLRPDVRTPANSRTTH